MKREYINEDAWRKIFSFLKKLQRIYAGSEKKCKQFFEALYWIGRTGSQWRELPSQYGRWNSIYKRFNAWSKKNIFDALLAFFAQDADLEYIMIDATIMRAHACSAGYGKQETAGLGRSKGGFTTKMHALTDSLGNLLKFTITAGQRHDLTETENLLKGFSNAYVIADRGYDCDALREQLTKQKCISVIPSKSNRKNPPPYDKHIYKERNLVEGFFAKLKQFRRVATRYDKSRRNFSGFISLVGVFLWLR
jgi:transposase